MRHGINCPVMFDYTLVVLHYTIVIHNYIVMCFTFYICLIVCVCGSFYAGYMCAVDSTLLYSRGQILYANIGI